MIDIQRYNQLKTMLENAQRDASRAEGELQVHIQKLKEEHGCKNIKEANELLVKQEAEAAKFENEYMALLAEFEAMIETPENE